MSTDYNNCRPILSTCLANTKYCLCTSYINYYYLPLNLKSYGLSYIYINYYYLLLIHK